MTAIQYHNCKGMHRALLAISAVIVSVALLGATGCMVWRFGPTAYFVLFHRPLNMAALFERPKAYVQPALPQFVVHASIAHQTVIAGDKQQITIHVIPQETTSGFLEVWVTSPAHKQVYRSPLSNSPEIFRSGEDAVYTFSPVLGSDLPKGTYAVSERITSATMQTDYYVHEGFITFQLQ